MWVARSVFTHVSDSIDPCFLCIWAGWSAELARKRQAEMTTVTTIRAVMAVE